MCAGSAVAADGRQVLVVGDGVAGLSAAAFLRRRGLDPTVVAGPTDGSTDHGTVDGTVTLWPTGVALLDELGATTDLGPSSVEIETWFLPAEDGTAFERLEAGHGEVPFLVADRRRLRWALRERLPTNSIRETKTPRTLCIDGDPPAVEFEDGVRERFDLVIGADGTDSWVRAVGFDGPEPTVRETTTWAFPAGGAAVPRAVTETWGTDAIVTVLPTASGARGRLVATADDAVAAVEVLARVVDRPGPPVADGFDLPGPDALVGAPDRVLRADPWVSDRIALLGDAAHSLPPCSLVPTLAVEDASVLAEELATHGSSTAAFEHYERRRRDRLRRLDCRTGVGARHRPPLAVTGLSELQELRRSLLRSRFERDSAGSTEDPPERF